MDVVWTAQLVDRLRQLHDTGLSFSKIAAQMNSEHGMKLTPNAVIGKARRLHFPRRLEPAWKARRSPGAKPGPKPAPRPPRPVAKLGPPGGELRTVDLGPPVSKGLTILELTQYTCHWPHGATPPYTYCGTPTYRESAFCMHHYNLAYVMPAKRWR